MKDRVLKYAAATVLAISLVSLLCSGGNSPTQHELPSIADPQNLLTAYLAWKEEAVRAGADRALVLPIGYSKGLSTRFVPARGTATLDLVEGSISVRVSGLAHNTVYDVWLVDNRPGPDRSVRPEPGDSMLRVGRLQPSGKTARLDAHLGRELLTSFKLDQVVVTPADQNPATAGLLFGSPSLFQRLFYAEQWGNRAGAATADASWAPGRLIAAPFSALVPAPAFAQEVAAVSPDLAVELVARGERLFFTETFNGNGRTCGTCHPAENNFTIDRKFIATRPSRDPLFVAEFNPNLSELEKPELMRKFGLILENVDGFDIHKPPVMRGVPHTLALRNSLTRPANQSEPPHDMTGWSGDGAPGGGSLRDFATGAVTQHFPKTLARVEGVDFRAPTGAELDALEAFQLALGRQQDLDLTTLVLKDRGAAAGQTIFRDGTGDPNFGGRCNTCHRNAGALGLFNGNLENRNFDTGVENRLDSTERREKFGIARDGGFGKDLNPATGGFGNGSFNSVVLVEAADTGPFFHNNVVQTIEEAIVHYNRPEFNDPRPATGKIQLDAIQATQVAAFLRVINAVENDRSAIQYATLATRAVTVQQALKPLSLAIHEVGDAIQVLHVLVEKGMDPNPVPYLQSALRFLQQARITSAQSQRNFLIRSAIDAAQKARGLMVQSG